MNQILAGPYRPVCQGEGRVQQEAARARQGGREMPDRVGSHGCEERIPSSPPHGQLDDARAQPVFDAVLRLGWRGAAEDLEDLADLEWREGCAGQEWAVGWREARAGSRVGDIHAGPGVLFQPDARRDYDAQGL